MTNSLHTNHPVLSVRNLEKSYVSSTETVTPVAGISLDVSAGELIMVYGPSGSGKTTLLNLMAGLDIPDRGSVLFMGENLLEKNDRERTLTRRRNLGVIFQGFELVRSMTCRDNIAYPLILQGIPADRHRRMVDEVAGKLGIADILHRKPDKISGGQQQRVAIARALVPEYSCILGDEITGALDRKTSRMVYNLLVHQKSTLNKSFILVSHDPELRSYADRSYDLREGNLS